MTQTETELPAGQEGIDRAGIAHRVVGMLLWPVKTFDCINRKPTWLAPLVIATVAMIFGNIFFNWRVNPDWEQLARNRIMQRMRTSGEQVPPEQIEQQVALSKTIGKFSTVLPVVLIPANCLILAGIFALGFNVLLQGQASFRKVLSVVAWSMAATKLASTVLLVAILLAGSKESLEGFDRTQSSLVLTNLAFILSQQASAAVKSFVSSLDVITIWLLVLLTIGFVAIAGPRKIKVAKVGFLVFGLWAGWVVVKVVLAAAFGS
jgi:Yip1 domain